ncbi:MAG: VTT domain-containing protein [Dehalococcoidales bacterium]|jgi:membrane protein YqaA with SNARE-associated domain
MNDNTGDKPKKPGILPWLRKRLIALAGLLGAVAIFAAVGIAYLKNPDMFDKLQGYGYLGAFVISVILNATIIIPVSNMTVVAALGATLPMPWLVGVIAGLGAGFGEMTGYVAGRSGRALLAKNKIYLRLEGWVWRWGGIAVFCLSILPLAFDIVGIIAGAMRMPIWKFFTATWLGRTISYVAVAYFGSMIFKYIPFLGN